MAELVSTKRRATYQDFLDAPSHLVAELVDGELFLTPRLARLEARASSVLGGILLPPFDLAVGGPGGWIVLDNPEVHLADDVVIPDLAGWRRERMPFIADEPHNTVAPDWICEVLSPSTDCLDRIYKLGVYARAGVKYMWLVYPQWRSLEELRLVEGKWAYAAFHLDDAIARIQPFEAIELDLTMLWRDVSLLPTSSVSEDAVASAQ